MAETHEGTPEDNARHSARLAATGVDAATRSGSLVEAGKSGKDLREAALSLVNAMHAFGLSEDLDAVETAIIRARETRKGDGTASKPTIKLPVPPKTPNKIRGDTGEHRRLRSRAGMGKRRMDIVDPEISASESDASLSAGESSFASSVSEYDVDSQVDINRPKRNQSVDITVIEELIRAGNSKKLQRTLDTMGDANRAAIVNQAMTAIEWNYIAYSSISPLAFAIMLGHMNIIQVLLRAGSRPDSEYCFKAGIQQLDLTFPAFFAVAQIRKEKVFTALVPLLIEHKADISAVASCNNSSLLWQAAYNGNDELVKYLLSDKLDLAKPFDIEIAATSLDVAGRTNTPLHAAARVGRKEVVNTLLKMKADVNARDKLRGDDFRTVLHDVLLLQNHPDLVIPLLRHKALVAADQGLSTPKVRPSLDKGDNPTLIADLFLHSPDNHAMITALAKGLACAQDQLGNLRKSHVVKFLRTPGDAPIEIMKAIFVPFQIRFWASATGEEDGAGAVRKSLTAGVVDDAKKRINGAAGPHCEALTQAYLKKELPPPQILEFFDRLAPPQSEGRSSTFSFNKRFYENLEVYFCPVHNLLSLEIIMALADCPVDEIFELPGCQAIVNILWRDCARYVYADLVLSVLIVIILGLLTLSLPRLQDDDQPPDLAADWFPSDTDLRRNRQIVFSAIGLILWFFTFEEEFSQCFGYWNAGLLRKYMLEVSNMIDIARLVVVGTVFMLVLFSGGAVTDTDTWQFLHPLTLSIIWMWLRIILNLRALRGIGPMVLPIISACKSVFAFLIVIALTFCMLVHSYIALHRGAVNKNYILDVWRAGVFGDREDVSKYDRVDVFFVVVTFSMGITLMNIFIAVLNLSYHEAYKRAYTEFMSTRCAIVADSFAWKHNRFFNICGRCTGQDRADPVKKDSSESAKGGELKSGMSKRNMTFAISQAKYVAGGKAASMDKGATMNITGECYLWYSRPKQLSEEPA